MQRNPNPLRHDVELHYLLGCDLPPLGHRIRIGRAMGTVCQYVELADGPTIVRVRLDEQPAASEQPSGAVRDTSPQRPAAGGSRSRQHRDANASGNSRFTTTAREPGAHDPSVESSRRLTKARMENDRRPDE
jgi:hypothetical protein